MIPTLSYDATGTWDVAAAGKPYGLAKGPYGSLFALCWQTPPQNGAVKAALLSEFPGEGPTARIQAITQLGWCQMSLANPSSFW